MDSLSIRTAEGSQPRRSNIHRHGLSRQIIDTMTEQGTNIGYSPSLHILRLLSDAANTNFLVELVVRVKIMFPFAALYLPQYEDVNGPLPRPFTKVDQQHHDSGG